MKRKSENMQQAIIQELNIIMDQYKDVFVVNADLGLLLKDGLDMSNHPERVIDVGIAEQNMISTAAGLALSGKIVFTTTIAEMAVARVLEQIRLDACYQNLNINMFGQGRGFAYGVGGSTHVMIEDVAMLRSIPNLTLIFPADAVEARKAIAAAAKCPGPKYIAFSRGVTDTVNTEDYNFEIGKATTLREGNDMTFIAFGDMVVNALDAAEELANEGISARVLNMHTLKPLDTESILKAAKETGAIVTVETHNIIGGLGSAVAQTLCENNACVPVKMIAARDEFPPVGDEPELIVHNHLDVPSIVAQARKLCKSK